MGRTTSRFRDATEARHAYRRADTPGVEELHGDWRVEFLGPARWRDDLLPKLLRALGLNKLFGMRFDDRGATHLLGKHRRRLREARPMVTAPGVSAVDGGTTVALHSAPDNGRLWDLVRSELRQLDDDTLLGMDLVGWGPWVLPMPFLLHRHRDD